MSFFDNWDTVEIQYGRQQNSQNIIRMRLYDGGDKKGKYRRMFISKNLVESSSGDRFILKTKGDTYALVPSENGPLFYKDGRIGGISHRNIDEIVNRIGCDVCSASVIDGAIVFPVKDNFIVG